MMLSVKAVLEKLKEVRIAKGFSISDVVSYMKEEVGMDISVKTVYGWEEGNSKPDISCFMAMCRMYSINNVETLFCPETSPVLSDNQLELQRVINLLTVIRDSEYVGGREENSTLSNNMKTEILYQLMDRAELEGKKKDVMALKWAILQIEKAK